MLLKKGAMFGLEPRALKKQFGELFLVRVQSVTPKEAHGARIQTKSGAMFGLDARIALAIFGALSVISGAALYSAIQQANVVQLSTTLTEANKAVEAYMVDTGQDLPLSPGHTDVFEFREILSSSLPGWSGPYLNITATNDSDANNYWFRLAGYNNQSYYDRLTSDTWTPGQRNPCGASKPCHYWITLSIENELYNAIDEYIDGEFNISEGNVRSNGQATKTIIHLKGPRVLNTPK